MRSKTRPPLKVFQIIEKMPETVIHLKGAEEQWKASERSKGQIGKDCCMYHTAHCT